MESETKNEDQQIAALLQLAGRRSPIAPEIADRVRANVRDAWQEETQRRRRRRIATWSAAIAATLALLILSRPARVRPIPPPALVADVRLLRGGASVHAGQAIGVGSVVSTSAASLATLQWRGHGSLRVAPESRLRFIDPNAIQLERGAVYFASDFHAPVTVRTKFGDVRDIGTQFEVRVDGTALRVRVREGMIALLTNGRVETAPAGIELTATGAAVKRAAIASNSPDWNWVIAAAPPVMLDGNARGVLVAIAREKGLTLIFADRALADRVDHTSLHDRVPLTPDEALDAATIAANLSYRVTGRTLMIDRSRGR